jgi:hypothetical protein
MQYILVHDGLETDPQEEEARFVALERRLLVPPPMPPTTVAPQHRRHPRTRVDDLLLKVRIGDGLVVARVNDLSLGGLFACTQREVPFGAFVECALLSPGHDEVPVTGVVVADGDQRTGLALRFESLPESSVAALRRLVLAHQVRAAGGNPDVDVMPTVALAPVEGARDQELDHLRRRVAHLQSENDRLRADVADADAAFQQVGRLRLELERLRATSGEHTVVDARVLADIEREIEVAWVAVARVTDTLKRLR